jgi:MarR family transcriptional regulator, exopolysaccharide II synthesis transcriptional activator
MTLTWKTLAGEHSRETPEQREETDGRIGSAGATHYMHMAQMIGRLHRRYLEVLTADLGRAGAGDMTAAQFMILFAIGAGEPSIGDIVERGHYSGSNVTASVKRLAEAGYVERESARRDRRVARIRLTSKAKRLLAAVGETTANRHRRISGAAESGDLADFARTLERLDLFWTGLVRYGDSGNHVP